MDALVIGGSTSTACTGRRSQLGHEVYQLRIQAAAANMIARDGGLDDYSLGSDRAAAITSLPMFVASANEL